MTPPAAHPGRSARTALLLWAGLLLCCAAFVVAFRALERQRREHARRDAEIRANEATLVQLLNADFYEPLDVFLKLKGIADPVAAMWPDGERTRVRIDGAAFGAQYADWSVRLLMRDDGTVSGLQVRPPAELRYNGPSRGWRRMDEARRDATVMAAAAWLVAMCLFPVARQWRRHVAQVALAAVIVAAVAWLADPARAWTADELRAPLPIAVMIAGYVGLFAFALPVPKPPARAGVPPCASCGYDLTGNVSGVCPECGLVTPRGMIDRWGDRADTFAAIELNEPAEEPVMVSLANDASGDASQDREPTNEVGGEVPDTDPFASGRRVCV